MKRTKLAYKVVKDNRKDKISEVKVKEASAAATNVVSFILVAKAKLCFRECARIVKVAEDTGCFIEIASGTKSGDTSSILSLVNLGIVADKSLVLTIKGERKEEAFRGVSKIISGTEEEE